MMMMMMMMMMMFSESTSEYSVRPSSRTRAAWCRSSRSHSTTPTPTRAIPREEIARVGRKDVGVSDESVSVSASMSVSWNAAFNAHRFCCQLATVR